MKNKRELHMKFKEDGRVDLPTRSLDKGSLDLLQVSRYRAPQPISPQKKEQLKRLEQGGEDPEPSPHEVAFFQKLRKQYGEH